MDAQLLTQIPHLEEIAHRGAFSGTPEKHTENFLERSSRENKILPSLEDEGAKPQAVSFLAAG